MVMSFTQRQQVVDVGATAIVPPPADVMDPTGIEADAAVGVGTPAVHRPQRSPLCTVGGTRGAAGVEHFTVSPQHDRQYLGVAAQAPYGGDR